MYNLAELIRQISSEAQASGQPTDIIYGKVVSVSPVSIQIDQKTTLTSDFLVFTRNVIDHDIEVVVDAETQDTNGHIHELKGVKKVTVKNGLKVGDKVILLKQAGGQSFVVLDKIGG